MTDSTAPDAVITDALRRDPGIYFKPLEPQPIQWRGSPICVVSLGCNERSVLMPAADIALQQAEIIFGSARHFDAIAHIATAAEKLIFASPFCGLADQLNANQQKSIAVLASGDALIHGIGSWLNRLVGNANLIFHPNISSIQSCFHHLGLAWQSAQIISLHGRPLSSLRRYLKDQQLIAAFTDPQSNPVAIAQELSAQDFGESRIWVCEAMGGKQQRVTQHRAAELAALPQSFHALNVCVIHLHGNPPALPTFPGIADHFFSTGAQPGFGMISKREVRLAILSLMQPGNGEIAWDIGAGCGSVSVEWARWNEQGRMYAIEREPGRIEHIKTNSERFGSRLNLTVIEGHAPHCCASLPDPDCVFIGGSNGLRAMLEYTWQRLKPGGKLVASAVTAPSRLALQKFTRGKHGREWIEIQVSKNLPDSDHERALSPVVLAKCLKP